MDNLWIKRFGRWKLGEGEGMRRGLGRGFFWLVLRWTTLGRTKEIQGVFWSKVPPGGLVKCVFKHGTIPSDAKKKHHKKKHTDN